MLGNTLLWLSEREGVFEFIKRNGFSKKLAARFVAGETLDGAIAAVRSLNANGISASLDLLGESVYDERQAESARDEVIGVLDRIAAAQLDANVSVKLTQMGLDIDSEVCVRNMSTCSPPPAGTAFSSASTWRDLRTPGAPFDCSRSVCTPSSAISPES